MASNRLVYNLNSVQVRSVFIPPGVKQSPFYNVFNTYAPKRITLGLVAAANFNGEYTKAFCNFQVSFSFFKPNTILATQSRQYLARCRRCDLSEQTLEYAVEQL